MDLQKIYSESTDSVIGFAESRIGGRSENQDSFGWADTPFGYLVTVCDGMGGGPGGKTASSIAVNEVITAIMEADKDEDINNILIKAVCQANLAIIAAGNENPRLRGMGSTLTLVLINEEAAYVAHVGDSRVYQLRRGQKIFRTFDHSMVFEMVEQGVITEEQARLSAQSNVITRALGIKPDLDVETHKLAYEKGDRFILCSDGIHGTMPESQLLRMIGNRNSKLGIITDDVSTYIDNLGRSSGGGHDNLTIAIIETKGNSKLKPTMSRKTRIVVIALAILLAASLVLNIVQSASDSKAGSRDKEISELRDSVRTRNDSIIILRQSLAGIERHAEKVTTKNLAPLDSIRKIVKTRK